MAAPFGIEVISELDVIPEIKDFKLDPGEKIWDGLERASSKLSILWQPSGDGKLVLTGIKKDHSGVTLMEGYDLLSCYANWNHADVFSEYIVKAQDKSGKPVVKSCINSSVKRYRPLEFVADTTLSGEEAQKKADWEAAIRLSRALEVSASLPGWTHNGSILKPNQIVTLNSPSNRLIEEDLLIKSVDLFFDDDGSTTNLVLTRQKAFAPEPVVTPVPDDDALKRLGYVR